MAAATGDVGLRNVPLEHMRSTIQTVGQMGAVLHRSRNDLRVQMNSVPKAVPYLHTAPYPGFPTDLQSPLLAALCKADGNSCIEERVFEDRFLIVEELKKMGAGISVKERRAYVSPVKNLSGCCVQAKDLRGGAALVIAALGAEGTTTVHPIAPIFRGYENIVRDLVELGAFIRTIS